ncbi:ankycorbin isoform X2 [Hypomesus transpacificus]|uniref:ankycorbin isoform X2 n=1 Tax=Hypomesus transpacificus TaxID=137520 RepID=UPI001F087063|nr:ankycorbin isoform X2 [Hypomesus transpacificus]
MKSLKAKFRKSDAHEWNKNDERLLAAVEHGEVDKVAALLAKKGASAVKLDSEGKSALHVAVTRGQIECLSVLLAHGADLSITDASGLSALHLAAKHNHQECAKKLVQSKCAVDTVDASGRTPLHHAAASGSAPIALLLCEYKSPVSLQDAEGLSPLLLSARHAHADVCSVLLDWGADINTCDHNGRTAVMLASESSSGSAVEVLVQRGADLSAVDSLGHDVMHYAKLSGSSHVKSLLTAALHTHSEPDNKSPLTPQHGQARLSDDGSTPKKRKAPPPPISPLQTPGLASPPYLTPSQTPVSSKSNASKRFNYQEEEELRGVGMALRGDVARLQEEKSMLLETIEDLKQILDQAGAPEETHAQVEVSGSAASALVQNLQARVTALSLENQQLAQIIKRSPQVVEEQEASRPSSMASNSSFHSTHEGFDLPLATQATPPGEDGKAGRRGGAEEEEEEGERGGQEEEIRLLRQTLQSVQTKLLESRQENRSLQALLQPGAEEGERGREEEEEEERGRGREEEVLGSLAELQAKLTETQERYHQSREELEELRAQLGGGGGGGGGDGDVRQEEIKRQKCLEQEVTKMKAQLEQSAAAGERAKGQIRELEAGLKEALEAGPGEQYREALEEIRMLQEALRGTVPVEAAARDFEQMKTELNNVTSGLQLRLLELSHSYSETKSELSSTRSQLEEVRASQAGAEAERVPPHDQEDLQEALRSRVEELLASLAEAEKKSTAAQQEITILRQEAERQAQSTVSLADHTQVVASLGNAIKELEAQSDSLRQQLSQRALQVDALQNRLTVEKDVTPDDTVSRLDHQQMRQGLEGEVGRVTQLLQGALRKQDEMALEAAAAWQEAREAREEKEGQRELLLAREKEVQVLSSRLAEAQDGVSQLKNLVENHVSSEREKNKRIDDLSREVGKLKDALNSLSQLSYSSSSTPKRQQNQQLETVQQQVKQLQYQLAESKKQHHEIVSVYRMHLLYAVQGQMDEDVQKALKQILMMCKMPAQTKGSC